MGETSGERGLAAEPGNTEPHTTGNGDRDGDDRRQ